MKRFTYVALTVFLTIFWVHASEAANRDVCGSGCAYTTIQEALDDAGSGDVVRVMRGHYFEYDIDMDRGISVTVQGGWNAGFTARSSDPAFTVIDALRSGRVFDIDIESGDTADVVIEGFTVTGGHAEAGGGIYVDVYTGSSATANTRLNLTLRNNVIMKNRAYSSSGGGVRVNVDTYNNTYRSVLNLVMINNRIIQNVAADDAGGIYIDVYSSTSYTGRSQLGLLFDGNRVSGNSSESVGGMLIAMDRSDYNSSDPGFGIWNNEICGNVASYGVGGLAIELDESNVPSMQIVNNVIAGNRDTDGIGGCDITSDITSPTVIFRHNTITGNDGDGLNVESDGTSTDPEVFTLNLRNNIISGNNLGDSGEDAEFDTQSDGELRVNSGYNVLGDVDDSDAVYNDLGNNTMTGNPRLGDDFYPLGTSPALNTANPAWAPATDKDGNTRTTPDRGALERQGSVHRALLAVPSYPVKVEYPGTMNALVTSDSLSNRPVTVGDIEGGTLNISVKLPGFRNPADVYLRLYLPTLDSVNVYQFPGLATLAASGPVKWKSGITGPVDQTLTGDIDVSLLSALKGMWHVHLEVTPANTPGMAYYRYETYFPIR